MRVSITFVLAVCAPLLALAAPISLNPAPAPPTGSSDADYYTPNWKRDDGNNNADGIYSPGWKRDDGTVEAEAIGSPSWKRDGLKTDGMRIPSWKRQGTSKPDGAPVKGWKA